MLNVRVMIEMTDMPSIAGMRHMLVMLSMIGIIEFQMVSSELIVFDACAAWAGLWLEPAHR